MTAEKGRHVVVGVDGGHGSAGAVRFAAEEARRTGAELRLVHVMPSYVPVSPMMPALAQEISHAGEEILEQEQVRLHQTAPDLQVRTSRLTGPRITALVDAAASAELLVIGRETRSGLERLMGAGTTAAVATHSRVPVVVVPEDWADAERGGPVVVGLKSLAHVDDLLRAAFAAAADGGVPLVVVHAWRLPDEYIDRIEARSHVDEWITRGEALAREALAPWRQEYPDVPVSVNVVHDDPAPALVKASRDASLAVLVRRPRTPVLGQHLGGTGRAVIRAATCPVMVVPSTEVPAEMPDLQVEASGAMLR